MKKTKTVAALLLTLIIAVCGAMVACGKNPEPEKPDNPVKPGVKVSFYQEEIEIEQYRTLSLRYKTEGADDEVPQFTSSDPQIGRVDAEGVIESIAAGEAVITASLYGATAECKIKVTETDDYPVLTLSRKTAEIAIGRSVTVTADVTFRAQSVTADVVFRSADDSIAEVTADGVVTGKSAGSTTVYVTASYHGEVLTEAVSVTVKDIK